MTPNTDPKIYGKLFVLQSVDTVAIFGEQEPAYYTSDGAVDMYGAELGTLADLEIGASLVDGDGDTWLRVQ